MSVHVVAVNRNADSRFMPYEDGQQLRQVISHWRQWPVGTDPVEIAEWAWQMFNVDVDLLDCGRGTAFGEADFLIAVVYRLMGRRSLSTGDVISITNDGAVTWLACEPTGWRQIIAPENLTGLPLTAEAVYRHVSGGGDER